MTATEKLKRRRDRIYIMQKAIKEKQWKLENRWRDLQIEKISINQKLMREEP